METTKPWDRLPNEGDAPWAAFEHYRMSRPEDRTVAATAKALGRARRTHLNYCLKYKWRDRVKAWDKAQAAAYDEEILNIARVKAREQMSILDDLGTFVAAKARELVEGLGTDEERPAELREIMLLAEKVMIGQRLIVGEATDRSEVRNTTDVSKLTPEARAALRRVMDELGVDEL